MCADLNLIWIGKYELFEWRLSILNLFCIANDCSVIPSDLSKMLEKKQMKYFDVPLEHEWKVPVLQELLNTRMNNLYVEGFDDYVITEMINMLCSE